MTTNHPKLEILKNAIRNGIGQRFNKSAAYGYSWDARFNKDCYVVDPKAITHGIMPQCVDVKKGTLCTVEAFAGDAMSLVRFPSGEEVLAFTGELSNV